ncbi:tetratricopeptide repeat protein 1 [Selaginella moellendorffii]|nr:tetratricopeptide repeat protein 1 [Selaginella moellendorffii]|eukprot:XP_002980175.2 tetratricopeptide repeat protein 1 [Selaginella moellendorffii]
MVRIQEEEEEEETKRAPGVAAEGWETASDGEDRFEDALTEDQQRERDVSLAERAKAEGNAAYAQGMYRDALAAYQGALELLADNNNTNAKEICSMCLCNRAMCYLQIDEYEEAVHESSKAIELNPAYIKAFLRRAQAHEKVDKLEDSLADMKKVLELDPANKEAAKAVRRLEPVVAERREKMKEEMLGKLKELGNSVLGRFGMSVDNFKSVKDPETGSYSISYQP